MTKKQVEKMLKDNDVEITPGIKTALSDGYKDVKHFTPTEWNAQKDTMKKEWQQEAEKKASREKLTNDLLTKHKVKANRHGAIGKILDLDNVEDDKLEETIKAGLKEYPEFKDIATPPTASPVVRKIEKQADEIEIRKPNYN